jgi:hypothetical protein
MRPRSFISGNICFEFLVQCICSVVLLETPERVNSLPMFFEVSLLFLKFLLEFGSYKQRNKKLSKTNPFFQMAGAVKVAKNFMFSL